MQGLFLKNLSRSSEGGNLWGAVCAIAIWLGFPNDLMTLPPLALLWPLALQRLGAGALSWRQALRRGWLAAFCGSLAALYWLCLPVAQVGDLPWPAAFACAALIAFGLSVQSGSFAILAYSTKNFFWPAYIALLALGWYLLEAGFALGLGFPWLPVAGALAPWPLLVQSADCTGSYLMGAIWVAVVLLLFCRRLQGVVAGVALAAVLLGYGFWRFAESPVETWPEGPDTVAALMVEGNVDQNQKWVSAFQKGTLELYLRLTEEGLAAGKTLFQTEKPLIIWPETALPFFYERRPGLARQLQTYVREFGSALLFGAPGVERNGKNGEDAVYNRAFLLSPDGGLIGYYDKRHLVPFGEYAPAWLKLDFLEALLQGVGIYEEGISAKPLMYKSIALGLLICYEGIFPWLAQECVENGANLLVDISNDGWFGRTPAARQHLYLTVLRCVEQGRWLLRATNTGVSAVVDDRGRVVLAGAMFKAGFLPCRARLLEGRTTIYHRLARWLPVLALFTFFCILAVGWINARRERCII